MLCVQERRASSMILRDNHAKGHRAVVPTGNIAAISRCSFGRFLPVSLWQEADRTKHKITV